MTLKQILEQWKKGLQVEAKLSYKKESSLIIYYDGELALSGVYVDDILGNDWEVEDVDIIEECGL